MPESTARPLFSFRGIFRIQTLFNIVYLFLSFPLGVFYFIFLATGLSLGVGLLVILVGIPILAGVFAATWAFAGLERLLARELLGQDLPPSRPTSSCPTEVIEQGLMPLLRSHLTNRVTWTSLLFLFLRFPLGVFSFVVTMTLISVSLGLLTSPFFYQLNHMSFGFVEIDTLPEALVGSVVGLVLTPISLMLLNALASLYGVLARHLLGAEEFEPAASPMVAG